jgi:hypothetical protein
LVLLVPVVPGTSTTSTGSKKVLEYSEYSLLVQVGWTCVILVVFQKWYKYFNAKCHDNKDGYIETSTNNNQPPVAK